MRTRTFLIVIATALIAIINTRGGEEVQKALNQLRGSWEVVKADGKFEARGLTFLGDTMTADADDPQKGRPVIPFKIDPTASLPTIDFLRGEEKTLGIYEVNGDTLKLCLAEKGGARPTTFETAKGVLRVLLKRAHGPRTLTLEYALGLLPKAASINNADFVALAKGDPDPAKIKNQPLSLVLLSLQPSEPDKISARDFRYLGEGIPRPDRIVSAMSLSQQKGYVSFLQPEYITKATLNAGPDRAEGTISFRSKELFEGTFEFGAEKQEAGWVITEFRLPNYKIRVTRSKEGLWERTPIKSEK